jgi:hypothetical protein
MFATACIANNNKKRMNEKLNHLEIDERKRKFRGTLKYDKGKMLMNSFLVKM